MSKKDSKKVFRKFSDKNPYMVYCGKISRCIKCNREFNGRIGAQAHSSIIHQITLDGKIASKKAKKKPQSKTIHNQNLLSVLPQSKPHREDPMHLIFPSSEILSDEGKILQKSITDCDKLLLIKRKIDELERLGFYEFADELRQEYNMSSFKKQEESNANDFEKILCQLLIYEKDSHNQDFLFKLLCMKIFGMDDSTITNLWILHMMNPTIPEKSEFEGEFLKISLMNLLEMSKNDPLKQISHYHALTSKKSNFLDDLSKGVKKFRSSPKKQKDVSSKLSKPQIIPTHRVYSSKLPSVREISPTRISKFSKSTYDGYSKFNESSHSSDSNMGSFSD